MSTGSAAWEPGTRRTNPKPNPSSHPHPHPTLTLTLTLTPSLSLTLTLNLTLNQHRLGRMGAWHEAQRAAALIRAVERDPRRHLLKG